MSTKPIFVATHPRACSTAFERVFMTCRDSLQCVHEPFGDAYYYGPERLHSRYEKDEKGRVESGFSGSTYATIFDRIKDEGSSGKRVFVKDMAYYLIPSTDTPASIAPSLIPHRRGVGTNETDKITQASAPPYPYPTIAESGNPTVVPENLLRDFHFIFLIRHPRSSIPSFFRCTIPPLDSVTGWYDFQPDEAGYAELVRMFDYLRASGQVGPKTSGQGQNGTTSEAVVGSSGETKDSGVEICVVDADDLLDDPVAIIQAVCKSVGVEYSPNMLEWDETDQKNAHEAFDKWKGFHEDAIHSTSLKPRAHKKTPKSDEQLHAEWVEKYGEEGAKTIEKTVAQNVKDYEYLKQFAIKI